MDMQVDETWQRVSAAPVYPPVARLRRDIRFWQQTVNHTVAKDERAPGDESVLLPNAAVLNQNSGHQIFTGEIPSLRNTRASITLIFSALATEAPSAKTSPIGKQ